MGKLTLEIPEDVQAALRLPPEDVQRELLKELAVALYQRQALSLGKARQLAGMTRWQFEDLLSQRRTIRHYSEEDLREDLDYARGS